MKIETRTLTTHPLELREDEDGTRHILGMIVPWGTPILLRQNVYEQFARSAFDKSVKERGDKIPLLESHNEDSHPVGMSVSFTNEARGLMADFRLAPTLRGAETVALAEAGIVTGLSVGFRPITSRTERRQNGEQWITRVEGRLDHVGFVTSPAYDTARVLSIRDADPDADPYPLLTKWRARGL